MFIQEIIRRAMHEATLMGFEVLYPWQVAGFSCVRMHEATIRKYMAQMAEQGLIERLGQRKGYRLN